VGICSLLQHYVYDNFTDSIKQSDNNRNSIQGAKSAIPTLTASEWNSKDNL
jgi:hypothetical protein